jgi:hypothetical protein
MIPALATLLLAAVPCTVLSVSASAQDRTAQVRVEIAGHPRITTRHWTARLHTLVVDLYGARLAIRPGTTFDSPLIRVRTGQFQARTARIVVESPRPFVYTLARSPEDVRISLRFALPATATTTAKQRTTNPENNAPLRAAARDRSRPHPTSPEIAAAARTFSIVAFGSLQDVAQTLAAITRTTIRVHPDVASRPAALNLRYTTLQAALAELARQTGTRWTRAPDGTIDVSP